jgi:hypothetical protein
MSTKFEQLLDFIVNEEMDKANELFHEIVVEKSRTIYENLIADEEIEESDEVDESDDHEVDESADSEMDEGAMDLEDSYSMEEEDDEDMGPPEETDDLEFDIDATGDEPGEDASPEEKVKFSIQQAMDELRAAFAASNELGGDTNGDFGDEEFDDEETGDEQDLEMGVFEGRRLREYTEKVGNDWEGNNQKTDGQNAGASTGDTESKPVTGHSPINRKADSEKPTSTANAKNIGQSHHEGQKDTGTTPNKVNKGITPEKGDKFASGNGNVPGAKMGVKNLKQVGEYGKGEQTKPTGLNVGARTGKNDNQGETNTKAVVDRKF